MAEALRDIEGFIRTEEEEVRMALLWREGGGGEGRGEEREEENELRSKGEKRVRH